MVSMLTYRYPHLLLASLLLLAVSAVGRAQLRGVVANAETGVPLRGATVYTNNAQSAVTDWRGQYALERPFTSATIVCPDFVSLTVEAVEMSDTLFLLPRFNTLAEVVVWGKRRSVSRQAVSGWQPSFVPKPSSGIGGLDILGLFRRQRPMSRKEVEKHNEVMRDY